MPYFRMFNNKCNEIIKHMIRMILHYLITKLLFDSRMGDSWDLWKINKPFIYIFTCNSYLLHRIIDSFRGYSNEKRYKPVL